LNVQIAEKKAIIARADRARINGVRKRQCECDAGAAQEGASAERGRGDVGHGRVVDLAEYDPATDSWRELGSLPRNLAAPPAAIIGDRIIVSCGARNGTSHPQSTTIIAPLPLDSFKRNL
jgi:hypothetical protein